MDSNRLLGLLLDVGTDMIRCGGETHRVEDTMYRLFASRGFRDAHVWVVPTNIQATVTDEAGQTITQIRHVRGGSLDYDRLDRLNALSRWACAEKPEAEVLARRIEALGPQSPQSPWLTYLAGTLGGWGFSLFFGCDLLDSLTAALASALIVFLTRRISRSEGNPLILNFFVSFVTELFIVLALALGLGRHMDRITICVVMLLISGLGATNGLRDLVHLDTLSGLVNLTASFTGALGIALGIAFPLLLFPGLETGPVSGLNSSELLQLLSATAACTGFALWFRVRGRRIVFCALGALLTWAVYLLAWRANAGSFGSVFVSAVFCGLYAQVMARVNKTPATVFSTIGIFPLVPGSSLYYAMYGVVTRNGALSTAKGLELAMTCFAIVLGYMVVEVANRFLWRRKS